MISVPHIPERIPSRVDIVSQGMNFSYKDVIDIAFREGGWLRIGRVCGTAHYFPPHAVDMVTLLPEEKTDE